MPAPGSPERDSAGGAEPALPLAAVWPARSLSFLAVAWALPHRLWNRLQHALHGNTTNVNALNLDGVRDSNGVLLDFNLGRDRAEAVAARAPSARRVTFGAPYGPDNPPPPPPGNPPDRRDPDSPGSATPAPPEPAGLGTPDRTWKAPPAVAPIHLQVAPEPIAGLNAHWIRDATSSWDEAIQLYYQRERRLSFRGGGIGFRGPQGLEWTVRTPEGRIYLVAVDGLPPHCADREEFHALVHRFHCGYPGRASIVRSRQGGQAPRLCRHVACVLLDLAPWGPELVEPIYSAEARERLRAPPGPPPAKAAGPAGSTGLPAGAGLAGPPDVVPKATLRAGAGEDPLACARIPEDDDWVARGVNRLLDPAWRQDRRPDPARRGASAHSGHYWAQASPGGPPDPRAAVTAGSQAPGVSVPKSSGPGLGESAAGPGLRAARPTAGRSLSPRPASSKGGAALGPSPPAEPKGGRASIPAPPTRPVPGAPGPSEPLPVYTEEGLRKALQTARNQVALERHRADQLEVAAAAAHKTTELLTKSKKALQEEVDDLGHLLAVAQGRGIGSRRRRRPTWLAPCAPRPACAESLRPLR